MNNDYLVEAVDTVLRKSKAALEMLSKREPAAGAQAVGVVEPPADIVIDAALIQETQRTLDMALEALEEIRNLDQKEKKRDG